MNKSIDHVATELLAEHRRLVDADEAFSGVVKLGELDSYLSQQDPADRDVQKWRKRLKEVSLDDAVASEAWEQADEQLDRMLHIMGIGSRFEYEELMLLVTIRTKLELFAEVVATYGLAPEFDPTRADEELSELAKSREHAGSFRSAKQAAKRNWRVPIVSKWLGSA